MNCDSLFMTHDRESLSLQNVKYSRAESVFSRFHAPFFILAHSQGSMQGFEILKCDFHNLTISKSFSLYGKKHFRRLLQFFLTVWQ